MTSTSPTFIEARRATPDALRAHWRLFAFQGLAMISLGALAIASPLLATLAVDLYVGWLFVISGAFALVAIFWARSFPGFLWTLVTALLSIFVGAVLLSKPFVGVVSLTAVMTAFFVAEGVFQAAAAVAYRKTIPHSWGWMLVSGLADLVIAAIIVSGWPLTVGVALGLIVGVNLLTSGWAVMMVALGARDVGHAVAT